ncbi:hypothetical protein [Enemella evansiae]|uniref:hypothetical protein n=1 Tax=Enemella evansiae TaxID=2016499 RepID=UPI00117F2386|nr:hypothetical protein [Enemella evansiae]
MSAEQLESGMTIFGRIMLTLAVIAIVILLAIGGMRALVSGFLYQGKLFAFQFPGTASHHAFFQWKYDRLAQIAPSLGDNDPLPADYAEMGVDGVAHRADGSPTGEFYLVAFRNWRDEAGMLIVLTAATWPSNGVSVSGGWGIQHCERLDDRWLTCWGD